MNNPDAPQVRVFFYGSFINRHVLARAGYHPDKVEVARLDGHDISLRPLATMNGDDDLGRFPGASKG